METITKKFEVYTFDELDEKVKNELIEKEKKYQYEAYMEDCLYNDLKYEAETLLQKHFKNAELKNIYYSLAYSQGDGAMMEFELYYYNKLIQVKHQGWYYHSRSWQVYGEEELTEKQQETLKNKIQMLQNEFEKKAWQFVEYEPETEICLEYLKDNKYLIDGSIF